MRQVATNLTVHCKLNLLKINPLLGRFSNDDGDEKSPSSLLNLPINNKNPDTLYAQTQAPFVQEHTL